ncbi:MFS transporter [Jejubacter calystegiae]|uniref:MFS transporter n=2 Tax=Jejubacter calystegiae TaxID=2579935 RepID=A0A4V1G824_9ENTR|nr:MFS transporter [Jejubacter calystegiae]
MSSTYIQVSTLNTDGCVSDKTYKKVYWRILPFLALCYMFAYLDRINVGFAKLQMQDAINLSDAAYGLGAGIFFLGYVIFEIPSNLYMARTGARKTLVRIMVLWGLTSACMMFVSSPGMFYLLRFMLGVFEAGFAPGIIYYLTLWFPARRMAGAMAMLMFAGPIGSIIGAPLSTWLMTHFHQTHGLQGWQWMFMLEGLPCVLLGIITWFYIVDKPEDARWLTDAEKKEIAQSLNQTRQKHSAFRSVLKNPAIYGLSLTYFGLICGIYAMSFWLPTILQSHGIRDTMTIGLLTAIPYVTALIGMIVFAWSSDKFQERRWHVALTALFAGTALLLSNFTASFPIAMLLLTLATGLMWASYTTFWAIPSKIMQGTAAAGGIALINSFGLIGGFVSPTIMGWIKQTTGSLTHGLIFMTVLLFTGAIAILFQKKI